MTDERLDSILDQDNVFIVRRPSGRSGNKIHLDESCMYLQQEGVNYVQKDASSYPVGFHDICGNCGHGVGDPDD